jgi:hypothetical protein
MPHPPDDDLPERSTPPLGGRVERGVTRIQGGDDPGDRGHRDPLVAVEHAIRQARGALAYFPAQGLDRRVAVEQDLQRIEQAYIDDLGQLVDELGTDDRPPSRAHGYLTTIVQYLAVRVK